MFIAVEHKIDYPTDFIAAVKAECPNAVELHRYLEAGDPQAHFELSNIYNEIRLSPKQILSYLEKEQVEELKAKTRQAVRIYNLVTRAVSIVKEHEAQNLRVG